MASFHQHYADQVTRLKRQQGWLIDLQRLLQPAPNQAAAPPRGQDVETQVDRYLVKLSESKLLDETDRAVAQHLVTTFRNRWWGLLQRPTK